MPPTASSAMSAGKRGSELGTGLGVFIRRRQDSLAGAESNGKNSNWIRPRYLLRASRAQPGQPGTVKFRAARPAGYVFLPGKGSNVLTGVGIKRAAGATSFLACLGFLCSRLLRCSPLGIRVLLIRERSQAPWEAGAPSAAGTAAGARAAAPPGSRPCAGS